MLTRRQRGCWCQVNTRDGCENQPGDDSAEPPHVGCYIEELVGSDDIRVTPTLEHPPANLIRQLKLVVVDGPDAGRRVRADADRMVIGKHESCDLVVTDESVSRFHCDMTIVDGRVLVRDLESKNGTTLDGASILAAYGKGGSIVQLGTTRLRIDLDDHVLIAMSDRERFGDLVGSSPIMRSRFALLERAAATEATVLLEGETGTGKEAAAEAIHRESARREGPFIVVDCGAVPPNLLEAELFGHERGAFTGAVGARIGAFEAATGGTIFLDEIGELAGDLQPKLLRALEKREIKRIGATHYTPIDVRIVAATNRNLRAEVNVGRFRSDLFYRLAVLPVRLPPLRERREDLPVIVDAILARLDPQDSPDAQRLRARDFIEHLANHAWPGNVRELRNYLERCLALRIRADLIDTVTAESTAQLVDTKVPIKRARENWNLACERAYLERLLREHENNVSAAARAAGIDRPYLYRLLWRHNMR